MISNNFLFEFNKLSGLILENKKDIIINKIGLPEKVAEEIERKYGKYAIWVANSFNGFLLSLLVKKSELTPSHIEAYWKNLSGNYDYVYDWLRGRSSGPVIETEKLDFKNLSLEDAVEKANDWHDKLKEISSGQILDEEGDVIMTFPDGFYWIKLNKSYCEKESEAMGHCGRGDGVLYSLRKDKYPFVTADIKDGLIRQMRGRANTKPLAKYHPYILDLILSDEVRGFDYNSYKPNDNFLLKDLDKKSVDTVLKKKANLFFNQNLRTLDEHQLDYLIKNSPEILPIYNIFSVGMVDIKNEDEVKRAISSIDWWKSELGIHNFNEIIDAFYSSGRKYSRIIEDVLMNNSLVFNYLFIDNEHRDNVRKFEMASSVLSKEMINFYRKVFLNTNRAIKKYISNNSLFLYIDFISKPAFFGEQGAKKALKLMNTDKIKELYIKEKGEKFYDVAKNILKTNI
jgi:hypothetical protein